MDCQNEHQRGIKVASFFKGPWAHTAQGPDDSVGFREGVSNKLFDFHLSRKRRGPNIMHKF